MAWGDIVTPEEVSATTMLFGAYHDPVTEADWQDLETDLGVTLGIRRSYSSGAISGTFSSTTTSWDENDRASWFSFKGDLATFSSGGYDSALTSWLNSVPAGHELYLTARHEPENDGIVAADFRSAMQQFYTVAKSARPETIVVSPLYMDYTFDPSSGRDPEDWYPGDAYTDCIGVDCYNPWHWPMVGSPETWKDAPSDEMLAFLTFCESKGKPWALGEFSSMEDTSDLTRKAGWTTDFMTWAVVNGCLAVCWFNIIKPGDTPAEMLVTSSAQSIAAYANMVTTYGR